MVVLVNGYDLSMKLLSTYFCLSPQIRATLSSSQCCSLACVAVMNTMTKQLRGNRVYLVYSSHVTSLKEGRAGTQAETIDKQYVCSSVKNVRA